MRIVDLLGKDKISLDAHPGNKQEAIEQLVALQARGGVLSDVEEYRKAILAREKSSSTAVGDGIAIPHAKSAAVKEPSLAAMTVLKGVDYEAMDGAPSKLLFMIAAPPDGEVHLQVLARLMTLLMDEDFRSDLLSSATAEEFLRIVENAEQKKFAEEAETAEKIKVENKGKQAAAYRVLAVTACPTGIAHTYMAAEALDKAGKKLGIPIKVETNGSGGVKNRLTAEEIAQCDGIIIAADKTVETARFQGKRVLSVKVSDGIRKPEELIQKIAAGEAPVYRAGSMAGMGRSRSSRKDGQHAGGLTTTDGLSATDALTAADGQYFDGAGAEYGQYEDGGDAAFSQEESFGRQMYKHLMNGVSNMLPFTVAGGIFIALAFLIDSIAGAPQDSTFGTYTPAAAFFKNIGGYAFNFMIPVLAGYIGKSIADRPGFLVGLVGGSLAALGVTFSSLGGDVPSGFLGALFAGFVGGYLMLGVERLCDSLPHSLEGIKPVLIYPLAGLAVISLLMCAVNPFMGYINTWLSDFLNSLGGSSKIILGCVLGGMMAVDMGGPLNKAAYVFGTAAIASGSYDVMAAVMVGGMVPPLAIALATTFFKSCWNREELKNGPVNYVMGLSFITEGAIPYAAADPIRVIPACFIGAAVAGGLSMAFGCTLMAPHGGIFVLAVVGNWLSYLLSLTAGSLAGMFLLALLKNRVQTAE